MHQTVRNQRLLFSVGDCVGGRETCFPMCELFHQTVRHKQCISKQLYAWVVGKRVSLMHQTLRNQRLLFSVDRIIFLAKFYMTRKICDLNHISPELNSEQVDELIGYYKTNHQKWFLYKKKLINIIN